MKPFVALSNLIRPNGCRDGKRGLETLNLSIFGRYLRSYLNGLDVAVWDILCVFFLSSNTLKCATAHSVLLSRIKMVKTGACSDI